LSILFEKLENCTENYNNVRYFIQDLLRYYKIDIIIYKNYENMEN